MFNRGSGGHILITFSIVAISFISSISASTTKHVNLYNLQKHHIAYAKAWTWQQQFVEEHISIQDSSTATLNSSPPNFSSYDKNMNFQLAGSAILLQHQSVYTLGSGTTANSGPFIPSSDAKTQQSTSLLESPPLKFETFQVDRAGQATYHGPGQLVLYPILDLHYFNRDINWYLRELEGVVIDTLAHFDIEGGRMNEKGYTGVWVQGKKVSALGIKLRRWVTMHGISLNVCPDMRYFDNIIPCGITDRGVTSMSTLKNDITVDMVADVLLHRFSERFQVQIHECDHKELK